jgi:CelD/BcsL family acetyltransferase involved in cellulose biosynthesis
LKLSSDTILPDLTVLREFDATFDTGGEWDQLLARSHSDTVFLLSGWLRAWRETLGREARLIIPMVRSEGRLIAAAAFAIEGDMLGFAGRGPSDYSDFVVAKDLGPAAAQSCVRRILESACAQAGVASGRLTHIPAESSTIAALMGRPGAAFVSETHRIPAPTMDMTTVDQVLKKNSLRRHEKSLMKLGAVDSPTFSRAADITPQLEEFFEQHVSRWAGTDWPSLFTDPLQRAFYRRFVERLAEYGVLRFTAVRLDGRLVASHLGFFHASRYTWYKPTFDPALSRISPGEVLLKRLFERAREEGASEFDFTIGNEAFKLRFATRVREVVDLHVTSSRLQHWIRLARTQARLVGERVVTGERLQSLLYRLRQRSGTPA